MEKISIAVLQKLAWNIISGCVTVQNNEPHPLDSKYLAIF